MSVVPIPEFAPDMPDMPSVTSDRILNVVPSTTASYAPQPSISAYASAISSRAQGAISAVDTSSNLRVFCGDSTKLYRMPAGATAFSNVSKVGNYVTASDGVWSFTQFGSRVIATNYNDPPQSYVEGTSALFADLIATGLTSLKAKYVTIIKDFVVFGNTQDGTYGVQPQRVHWTAINDPTNVPTPGTTAAANALSDFQDIVGTHGAVKGILGNLGNADGAVFMERAIFRMTYSGMPNVFDFSPAESSIGLIASGALTQFGGSAFYISEDGFKMFDGASSRAIGRNKVDKFFFSELDRSYMDRISSTIDPSRGLVMWAYPKSGSLGVCNRVLIYNIYLDRWSMTNTDDVRVTLLLKSATFGKTLEQLDAFGTLETLPYSLDSQVWIGGTNKLAGFNTSHQFGYFDGSNLTAYVDTSDFEPNAGRQSLTNYVRPLADATSVTVAVAARDRIMDAIVYSGEASLHRTGLCPVRARGRYHRYRIKIPAGTTWNHISGIDIENTKPMGLF